MKSSGSGSTCASSAKKAARLLQFVTGSCRVPVGGFDDLPGGRFQIRFTSKTSNVYSYPVAHTCENWLDLPPYKDKETLKQMLLEAMVIEGFGIA